MTERIFNIQCWVCTRFLGELKCLAFPNGIPMDILEGKVIHDHLIDGDSGVLFENISKWKTETVI